MNNMELSEMLKYLVNEQDFVKITNGVFADCFDKTAAKRLLLLQIIDVNEQVEVIAGCGDKEALGKSGFFDDGNLVLDRDDTRNSDSILFPIFIRDSLAMYVYAEREEGFFSWDEIKLLTEATLLLQNIAAEQNFVDSLDTSYKVLGVIMNQIPTGLAVLDSEKKDVLMMNELAAKSESIQSAMGIALSRYMETGDNILEEIYEKTAGLWFDVRFEKINWLNGNVVLMCTTIDVTQKVKNQQRAEYQANNDYLTGLFNRMKCERDLNEIVENAVSEGKRGVAVYLDLDDFKQVNDGLGHQYGDVLLQEIAAGIQSIPQIANSCYRMGGDEFVIVIRPEAFDSIVDIVEQICAMFARPWNLMGVEYYSTMSMGLAVFPDDGTHVHDVLKKADFAMYEAKKNGKNRYLWYNEIDVTDDEDKNNITDVVKQAVDDNLKGFSVKFLPVADSDNNIRILKAELEYSSEEYGKIEEDKIFTAAEYVGALAPLGDFMLRSACDRSLLTGCLIMVPVNEVMILAKKAVDNFLAAVKECNASPANIILSLSEKLHFRDEARAKANIEILRAHGFNIGIDDFGAVSASVKKIEQYGAGYVRFDASDKSASIYSKALEAISEEKGIVTIAGNCIARGLGIKAAMYDGKCLEKLIKNMECYANEI